ncbi:hypothetical protein VitviT2T_013281 [Vitis vinifera]|uniref:Uncharacterized protein n=1 Tax=Vitis vinifera TaxID=29760 RepID=A0ABY9CIR1_VITVI|nr:hypothetical protein VitviT2T_013281 [Vitis vinifera]
MLRQLERDSPSSDFFVTGAFKEIQLTEGKLTQGEAPRHHYANSYAFTVGSSDHPLKYPKPNPNPSLCIVLIVAGDQSSNHHHPQSQMGNLSISLFLYSESSLGYSRVCSKWDDAFQVRFMDRWLVPVR